jgi:glutamine amidotransferase
MLAIIDYGMGNLGSIQNMLKYLGYKSVISNDPGTIAAADKLILPGVGAFDNGMENLNSKGLTEILNRRVLDEKVPVLGICLGMQLLSKRSEEGRLPGLGWIDAETIRFSFPEKSGLRIPHMGWNSVAPRKKNPLIEEMPRDAHFYFVHSYHVTCRDPSDVLLTTSYGIELTSAVARGNIYGVQFHPEKSHRYGMGVLRNFMERV